ncbi:hypothetical protein AGMMS50218_00130 [Actinomycetota bacterium]|nr:hypothetical protein AGMMS50218_00130 [Actinomycetota bacterium]
MSGALPGAVAAHRDTVRRMSRPGGALDASSEHATVRNPEWFRGPGEPRAARRRLHERLVAEQRQRFPDVRADKRAVVLAGPPGAGKSSVLRAVLGVDAPHWLVVDADEFKRGLLTVALQDGSFERFIVPPQVRELEVAGERFAPLELAALVHEESSLLAQQLRGSAIDDDLNLVLDTVLSGRVAALGMGERLAQAGYEVRVVDVETTYAISAARVEERWRGVTRGFLADGTAGLGGRWVPSEYTRALFPAELGGRSVCEEVARELAETCPAVSSYEVHRVHEPTAAPVLDLVRRRTRLGGPLVDTRQPRHP